jgi:uncharacterized cofD-like protein
MSRDLLQKRLGGESRLKGHSVGNMLLTMLYQYTGDFPGAVDALGEILEVRGRVLPITTDRVTLVAELEDKSHLYGEAAIDVPAEGGRKRIKRTFLVPHHGDGIKVCAAVPEAIMGADFILIGPGDLYTSITPNFLVSGVPEALSGTEAKIIYISNIMTKFGETDNFTACDFIKKIEKSMGRQVDAVIANSKLPDTELLKEYQKQKAEPVKLDLNDKYGNRRIFKADVLSQSGGVVRHDPDKLAQVLKSIFFRHRD